MYYPYFRGKQNELIVIRENAELLAESEFIPVIEPVKASLSGLKRALDAVKAADGNVVVVLNSHHGDFASDGENISALIESDYADFDGLISGIILSENVEVDDVIDLVDRHQGQAIALIHAGFKDGKKLADRLTDYATEFTNIFIEGMSGRLYRRHFKSATPILIDDGFERRKNREYPGSEFFSDLHITYDEEGMDGFGDFLIVGDEYSETGGPAYAVAIHITCIDQNQDDEIWVHHFISDRVDTPTDPAGKFAEALAHFIEELNDDDTMISETDAIREFRDLHERGHFPGLGYVKKLSMQHHIEMLAKYFED